MDIGSSFTYMFEDESWIKKILIGGIVSLVPIVNFAAMGYVVEVIRNVRDGRPTPLPEWDQFGQMWMSGLWLAIIGLVYFIPVLVLGCIMFLALGGFAMFAGNGGPDEAAAAGVLGIIPVCLGCLLVLWGLVLTVIGPAIVIRFAETGQFNAGFQFSELVSIIKVNPGSYLVVLLLLAVAMVIIAPVGSGCIVGLIFTQFYAWLVSGSLLGQLAAGSVVRSADVG